MSSTQATEQKPIIPPPNEKTVTAEERAALEAYAARDKIQCSYKRTAMKKFWKGSLILSTKEQQDEYDAIAKLLGDSVE